jgi:hypothetical protein
LQDLARAAVTIGLVSALMWGALGFFLFVLLATTVGFAVLGIRGWRLYRSLRGGLLGAMSDLTDSATTLEQRIAAIEQRSVELQKSVGRLSTSLARARVLLRATQDVRDVVGRVQGVIPRK